MDIAISPLTVWMPGEPDDALDEVIARQAECHIIKHNPQTAAITIGKDVQTHRFSLAGVNPEPEYILSLLINWPPPCSCISDTDDPVLMLLRHLPAGTVHLEHLSEIACYIGLFSNDQPRNRITASS